MQHDDSRYFRTPETIHRGFETFSVWDPPDFLKQRPAENKIGRLIISNYMEGRPDRIASELYNSPHLDWVLIAFNKVRNPLNWPRAGDMIEYPVKSLVFPSL